MWYEPLVTWPSLGVDRAASILTPNDDHKANAKQLCRGLCDSGSDCDIVPDGSFYRFRSRSNGEELTRILAEGRRLLKAEGHRPVRGRLFWDAKKRQRSFLRESDCAEPTEGVGTEVSHDETAQVEIPDGPDTLWVLSDPLEDDFKQTVEASSVLHAIGDRRLSRGGSFVRLLPVQEVENSAAGCWKSWVHQILKAKPFPDKRLFGKEGSGRFDSDNPANKLEPAAERDAVTENLRTCWIDTNKTGSRFKTARKVVLERNLL